MTKSRKRYPNRLERLSELGEGTGGKFTRKLAIQFRRCARRVPKKPLAGRGENQDLPATVPGIPLTIQRTEALQIVSQTNNEARRDPKFAGQFVLRGMASTLDNGEQTHMLRTQAQLLDPGRVLVARGATELNEPIAERVPKIRHANDCSRYIVKVLYH